MKPSDAMDEADALGVNVGMLVAGSIVETDLLPRLGPLLGMLEGSPVFEEFCKSFVHTLVRATKNGVEGVRERSSMAYVLRQTHNEVCKAVTSYTIEKRTSESDVVTAHLTHLIDVARAYERAANALHLPIERNIEMLIEERKKISAIRRMQQHQEADRKIVELASTDCDNPHCPIHAKN